MKNRFLSFFLILFLLSGILGISVSSAAVPARLQSYLVLGQNSAEAARLVEQVGGTVTSRLDIIAGVGALLSPEALTALRANPVVRGVTPNQTARISEDTLENQTRANPATDYPDLTGADLVWQAGVTGKGVAVAVLDTGISLHPGLFQDLNNRPRHIVGWKDFIQDKRAPRDPNGHGTHVAGIIANTQTGSDGEWNGMAPGIQLVGVRVLDETGSGTYETIIQGLQWVVDHKDRYNIRVVNLSLQANPSSSYWADPLNIAVTRTWAEGIVVVTVAGNGGPDPMTLSVPGNNPYAITVGAFTDAYTVPEWSDDTITPFSSSGPTLDGFVKPDLIAPGAHITSIMFPGSFVARSGDATWVSSSYFNMAGTSQAAAITSGAAALVLARNPSLTPDQVKYRLAITALPWVAEDGSDVLYSMWQQGAGRLNVYDAVMKDELIGTANQGMDIWADLAGTQHYEGYTYFDETDGQFRLRGVDYTLLIDHFGVWDGGAGAWSGGAGAWSGSFGAWTGGAGAWSGGAGAWSGGAGAWSGGAGAWSGGAGAWSGGAGAWSGGYTTWAGGAGAWSGGAGAWSGSIVWSDPIFVENFVNGVSPDGATSAQAGWTNEP